jgi:hypothetical protein
MSVLRIRDSLIRIQIWIRILLFSSMAFKMPKKYFLKVHLQYISLQR